MSDRDATAEEVLGACFEGSYSSLVGLARLLLDRREEAEEVVQEAFARTLVAMRRTQPAHDAYPYVRAAVLNLSRSGLRRRGVVRRWAVIARGDADAEGELAGADVEAERRQEHREVIAALHRLPRRQRECVVLRYFEGASTAEAAGALGISEGAVKTHLHRALGSMAAVLEGAR